MVYSQDLLTHIINVHFGGGEFAFGTDLGEIYFGSGTAPGADNDEPPFKRVYGDETGYVAGISVAVIDGETVWVAVCYKDMDFYGPNSGFQIAASRNGTDWNEVYLDVNIPISGKPLSLHYSNPVGIVWDGNQFHAASYFQDLEVFSTSGNQKFYRLAEWGEQLYSSPDGFSWTKGEKTSWSLDEERNKQPSKLKQYCTKSQNENGIPDGLQGFDDGILGKPGSLVEFYGYAGAEFDPYPPSSAVSFSPAPPEGVSGSVGFPCWAVAYSGGKWIAAGKRKIALAQQGQSFQDVFDYDGTGVCIVGIEPVKPDARL